MIPNHCYYKPSKNNRGDAFIIDRHPLLPKGKRDWSTTSRKDTSTSDKFKQLKIELSRLTKSSVNSGSKSAKY